MEKLSVQNFLNLQNVDFCLASINIFIGPQAHGKSVVAKLIYFFKDFLIKYRVSIIKQQSKRDFDKNIINNFKKIFPEYSWREQDFVITYVFNDYQISIFNQIKSQRKGKLGLQYSEYLVKVRKTILTKYKAVLEIKRTGEQAKLKNLTN